ncbi:MAG: undecaprenyl-phosphate glucose phosphotransferase [Candidatus Aminicenantia bacterium]
MIQKKYKKVISLFLLSDLISIFLSFFAAYYLRFYSTLIPVTKGIPSVFSYLTILSLFLFFHFLIFYLQGFYKIKVKRTKLDDFFVISVNSALTAVLILGILSYLHAYSSGPRPLFKIDFQISHLFLLVYFILNILITLTNRSQVHRILSRTYQKGHNLRNVLIIGAGELGKSIAEKLSDYKTLGYRIRGFLDEKKNIGETVTGEYKVIGRINDLTSILEKNNINDIYIALPLEYHREIIEIMKVANNYIVDLRLVPDLFQYITLRSSIEDLDGIPIININEVTLQGWRGVIKRIMDIILSFSAIILFSPLFISISILIKLTSKGPILYNQERVGMDGKKFIMHKFRTMIADAEKECGPVMTRPDDPRLTKFGKFLRRFSLDELPQFFNVLKGEMSLVGPRPERPVFVKKFRNKIPQYMLRHKVKSGITGWAQVHGLRQNTPLDKRLEYDLYYIENWSLFLDLKIIWMTLKKGFIDKTARI